jgi:hypothetical protein
MLAALSRYAPVLLRGSKGRSSKDCLSSLWQRLFSRLGYGIIITSSDALYLSDDGLETGEQAVDHSWLTLLQCLNDLSKHRILLPHPLCNHL